MAQPKPWLKMWREWIHDPKMLALSLAEQGAWWRLVTLAQECDAEGAIVKGGMHPLSMQEIMACLHITKQRDIRTFQTMVQKMEAEDSITFNRRILTITHFAERQELTPSASKEAVRDRVRRHRERQRHLPTEALGKEIRSLLLALPEPNHQSVKDALIKLGQAKGLVTRPEAATDIGRIDLLWQEQTGEKIAAFEIDMKDQKPKSLRKLRGLCPSTFIILPTSPEAYQWDQDILLLGLARTNDKESKTPRRQVLSPLTTPTKDKDIDTEAEVEVEGNAVTAVTFEPTIAEITKLHEENFGIITPLLAEKFKDFVENYRGPIEWIKEAFAQAVTNNVRKWVYVESILDRWQREGRKQHGRGVSPGREAPAHKQSPHAAAKRAGWTVGGEDEGDSTRDQE